MGFLNFILKFGVVGSAARWSAKHYLRLKTPDLKDVEVMREMVEFRYKIIKDDVAKAQLLDRLSHLDNLTELTFSILQLEGAIKTNEMPMHMQMQATSVIMRELSRKGVPQKAIVGEKTI